LQFPGFINIECGQELTVEPLTIPTTLSLSCSVFNGSNFHGKEIYKDGILISNSFSMNIYNVQDDEIYGTYTFRVTTKKCGSDEAISRIFCQG